MYNIYIIRIIYDYEHKMFMNFNNTEKPKKSLWSEAVCT